MQLLILTQDTAYNAGYSIGYVIGAILPFVFLVVMAYFIYKFFKKKSQN